MSRTCTLVALVLLTLATLIHVTGANPLRPNTAFAAVNYYGANQTEMSTVTSDWPQHQNNWCGVSDITAINKYAYWAQGISGSNSYTTQESFGNQVWQTPSGLLNQDQATSPWGYSVNGGAFSADIAADGGTDPRAIAWGLYTVTPNGYYYHNYIYPGSKGADYASRLFLSDFGPYKGMNQPIEVAINGGAHSVIISAVEADRDPSADPFGATIYYVLVWDSWYGQTQWTPYNYYNNSNVFQWQSFGDWKSLTKWWGRTYNTSNGFDPDPLTSPGNYYNVPPLSTHWGGNYVTVERDTISPSTYGPNIALDNNGKPVPHN